MRSSPISGRTAMPKFGKAGLRILTKHYTL